MIIKKLTRKDKIYKKKYKQNIIKKRKLKNYKKKV